MKRRKPERKKNTALPGYSLLYVLFFLTILALIISGLITYRFFCRRQSLEWMGRANIERNVQSAITLMRDQVYTLPEGQPVVLSLFNDVNDSVTLCRARWGFFSLLKASARFNKYEYSLMALCGDYHHGEKEAALLLGNTFKPLCICGNTLLKGIFKVPKAGIKAGSVAGNYYRRSLLVEGEVIAKDSSIPIVNACYLHLQPQHLLNDYAPSSRVVRLRTCTFNDTLSNSFEEPLVILYAKDIIILDRCVLRGNVMVISDSTIRVESKAQIADAILCAKNIFIEPRFKGTGQFIATDTLRCGHSCTFPVPSILAVINQAVNPVPFIYFEEHCHIEGAMLAWTANPLKQYSAIGVISEHSRIVGSLYTNGEISLLGEVHGNVISKGFILRKSGAIYQNYLMDAMIDYSRQPKFYTGISYQPTIDHLNIIKWLQ